jgi:hypothetical protein
LTTPFEDLLFEPDIAEQGAQALAERLGFLWLVPNGVAQDLAHFLFGAPTVLSRTLLELRFHVVFEVSNYQLSHDMPSFLDDIMISLPGRPCKPLRCRFGVTKSEKPPARTSRAGIGPEGAGSAALLSREIGNRQAPGRRLLLSLRPGRRSGLLWTI